MAGRQPPVRVLGEDDAVRTPPRPRGRRTGLLPALTLAAALVLSACTDTTDDPADPGSASPDASSEVAPSESPTPTPPPVPEEGACYDLDTSEITSPTSDVEPQRCREEHTARTFHVGTLRTRIAGRDLAVDSPRVARQPARTCPARLVEFLGGTPELRALSRITTVWFTPTLAESEAGARWFRCDLVVFGKDTRLLPLTGQDRFEGVLDRPEGPERYGLCGTARPGSAGFTRVACELRHTWVAIGTIPLEGRDYPGTAAVRETGDQPCADRVRAAAGLPLEFEYGWEWPTRAQWEAGQRYGYCWAPQNQVG